MNTPRGAPFAAWRARCASFVQGLPRDKADTLLLLAGALTVLAPHAAHLPAWVSAMCATTLAWRTAITLRGTRLPPPILLLPLAVAAVGGVFLTYQTVLGRDAGVAMLVLLVAFKMLEMRARRDLFVVIFLCFFLLLTSFFYAQGIGSALMMAVSIAVLFGAQLSFQFTGAAPPLRRRLWLGARVVLLAAPLALLLFFVFPRLQGPLWGMPGDARAGRTGLSNSMAPGNMSSLAQSEETAFTVRFIDPAPPQQQLYWRGVVLGDFDGRTWLQAGAGAERTQPAVRGPAASRPAINLALHGRAVRHQVTLEPTGHHWLFALDLPAGLPHLAGNGSAVSPEVELSAADPIDQRVRYDVVSHPGYSLQADAELARAERWLALPDGFNPRAVAAGAALRRHGDPATRINIVLRRFHDEAYSYTLEPPLLGRDSVDEFLYRTRAGFCEHYASAFVVLMRAAGVPARVVTGYQGGEVNPVDGFLTVRQSDAHAWAEVWLAGRGWLRIDPTAAVAPERVRRGLARALPRTSPFGLDSLGFDDDNSVLSQLRFRFGALNNGWNQWVLNYTPERQRGAVEAIKSGALNPRMLAVLAAAALLVWLAHTRRARRRGDPVDAVYSALCLQLGRLGLARAADEGPNDYRARLARPDSSPLAPHQIEAATEFLRLYSAYKYGVHPSAPGLVATLKTLLTKFR
ncbi:MAG: transglutaminase [Massilia sp.]|nr:transglutaminase [Massilia sp.]